MDSTVAENLSSHHDDGRHTDDSLSLHSTSSKSWSFSAPSLKRRPTDRSSIEQQQRRTRSDSNVLSEEEEDVSGLGIEVELELQKQDKGGQWGIGDEARMNLE